MLSLIHSGINAAMQVAWKPIRGIADGVSGTTKIGGMGPWRNSAGEAVSMNPAQKLARRLRADAQQILTGNKYNHRTMEKQNTGQGFFGRHIGNRVSGVGHLVGDLTLGTAGTAIGWGVRGAGALTYAAAKPLTRGLGHVTYQGARAVGGTALDVTRGVTAMSRNPIGREVLFGGALIGAAGIGMSDNIGKEAFGGGRSTGLSFYQGGPIESLPGTLAHQGAGAPSNMMVDTGADGELVLAMHNLR